MCRNHAGKDEDRRAAGAAEAPVWTGAATTSHKTILISGFDPIFSKQPEFFS